MHSAQVPSDRRLLVVCTLLTLPAIAINLALLLGLLDVPAAVSPRFSGMLANAMDRAVLVGGALSIVTVPWFFVVFFRRIWERPPGVVLALVGMAVLMAWPIVGLVMMMVGLQDLS